MDQQKIGKFIQERRKEKKLTQLELAEKLGVSNRTISKWETGKSLPDYSTFNDLCNELDISINELLSGEKLNKENYQKKLEENFVSTIDYNNKKRNKKIRNIFIILFILIIIYFMYKAFIIFYYDTRLVSEDNDKVFPNNKEIYTLKIKSNDKANNAFNEYGKFNIYIPDDFELITDKAKSNMVMDACNFYVKGHESNDKFDAGILICYETKDNIYNLDYFGIESTLFPYLDVYKVLNKYNINNTIDLIKYYERNYLVKENIFTDSDYIKMNYIASKYVKTVLSEYDKFYYLDNDLEGYMIENDDFYYSTFYKGVDSYRVSFFNNKENYFEYDNVVEIISSIK